jgi:protein-disulfide isomerase
MADAASVGVTGTPAFFINGRMLSGAQPFEKFKEIIEQELAASSKS